MGLLVIGLIMMIEGRAYQLTNRGCLKQRNKTIIKEGNETMEIRIIIMEHRKH